MSDQLVRVNEALALIKTANAKLTDLYKGWADPPDPDKPAVQNALNDVKTQGSNTIKLADALLVKAR